MMAVRLVENVACKNKLCDYEGTIDRYEGDGKCLPYELSDSEAVCPECGFKTLIRSPHFGFLDCLKHKENNND